MKALAPNVFRTGAIVDSESINGNLRRAATDVNRSLSRKHTFMPPIIVPLDGVTNVMTAALRSIVFAPPGNNNQLEVVKVEFFVYATAGVTWTLSVSGATWQSIDLATAGASTEAYAVSDEPIAVPAAGVTFSVAGDGAGTITRGWLVLHCRADRTLQSIGPDASALVPTIIDATTSTAGSVLDAELSALETKLNADSAFLDDMRCACFVARNFTATQQWNLPSGAGMNSRTALGYIVATAADSIAVAVESGTIPLTGTGTGNIVSGSALFFGDTADDPTDTTDDVNVEFNTVVGTVELAYAFIWWN